MKAMKVMALMAMGAGVTLLITKYGDEMLSYAEDMLSDCTCTCKKCCHK